MTQYMSSSLLIISSSLGLSIGGLEKFALNTCPFNQISVNQGMHNNADCFLSAPSQLYIILFNIYYLGLKVEGTPESRDTVSTSCNLTYPR